MTVPLTRRLKCAFDTLERLFKELGRAPTRREFAAAAGLKSVSGAQRLLVELRERGVIDVAPGRANAIRILPQGGGLYPLPAALQRRLEAYCVYAGELPSAVIADAVTLHLDDIGPRVDADATAVDLPPPAPGSERP